MKILLVAIWTFIVLYVMELLGVTKNVYYLSIVLLTTFGGMLLIFHLFKVKDRKEKIKQ